MSSSFSRFTLVKRKKIYYFSIKKLNKNLDILKIRIVLRILKNRMA
jgi:hypothetical protein